MLTVRLLKRLKYYDRLIYCPVCRKPFSLGDELNMDIGNTLTHKACFNPLRNKDSGTYREIIEKYPDYFPLEDEKEEYIY
ncbi:hypothetical protein [Niallia sp. 03133]|uniref:hypothetical protein n=1 Tax=Niallia sp. 03133 TaxID=3458060 RepID=UPI00404402A0